MDLRGTTILAVLDDNGVAMAGDGQVTLGQNVAIKHGAKKVRRIYKDSVLAGFAGATADARAIDRATDRTGAAAAPARRAVDRASRRAPSAGWRPIGGADMRGRPPPTGPAAHRAGRCSHARAGTYGGARH